MTCGAGRFAERTQPMRARTFALRPHARVEHRPHFGLALEAGPVLSVQLHELGGDLNRFSVLTPGEDGKVRATLQLKRRRPPLLRAAAPVMKFEVAGAGFEPATFGL